MTLSSSQYYLVASRVLLVADASQCQPFVQEVHVVQGTPRRSLLDSHRSKMLHLHFIESNQHQISCRYHSQNLVLIFAVELRQQYNSVGESR